MTRSGVVRVELILQRYALLLDEDLFSNLHSIYEGLRNMRRLLGKSPLAVIAVQIGWPEESDERSAHCGWCSLCRAWELKWLIRLVLFSDMKASWYVCSVVRIFGSRCLYRTFRCLHGVYPLIPDTGQRKGVVCCLARIFQIFYDCINILGLLEICCGQLFVLFWIVRRKIKSPWVVVDRWYSRCLTPSFKLKHRRWLKVPLPRRSEGTNPVYT